MSSLRVPVRSVAAAPTPLQASALLAGVWSLAYAALGIHWWSGGGGFPFGIANDPEAGLSLLAWLDARTGAPLITGLGIAGAVLAGWMASARSNPRARRLAVAVALGWAAVLAVLLPDYRVLVVTAYAPIFVVGAPFGWPEGVSLLDEFTPPLVNQFGLVAGGLLWARLGVLHGRAAPDGCARCGRRRIDGDDVPPGFLERWAGRAVAVAVAVPLFYAATRYAWAVGVPLGIGEATFRAGQASGAWTAGALLATLAVGGALLTTGLVRPWGEVVPGWLPVVGGRRVPVGLAVAPASFVAVLVAAAGVMFVRLVATDTATFGLDEWGALLPEVLWPLWGAALGVATIAYDERRREPCPACARRRSRAVTA